jgi:dipeptidyl aminopeptidase/acylaminoacyl peptidase
MAHKALRVFGRLAAAALALALLASLGFGWYVAGFIVEPPYVRNWPVDVAATPVRDPRSEHGLAFEDVEFRASDGLALRGWWIPRQGARRAIVAVHGAAGTRLSFLALAPLLHGAGYSLLLFDSRGHGESDGPNVGAAFASGYLDVLAAAQFAREAPGIEKVAALGASQGASSALLAGGLADELDAVVAQAGGTSLFDLLRAIPDLRDVADFQIDVIAAIAKWRIGSPASSIFDRDAGPIAVVDRISPTPLLIIHGSNDEQVPLSQGRTLFERAREPKELWVIEGGGHRGLRSYAETEYGRRVVAFLDARM